MALQRHFRKHEADKLTQMLSRSPHGLKLLEKYSHKQCTQCFRSLPHVYQCGNCEQYYCPTCELESKTKVITSFYIQRGEPLEFSKVCKGQFEFACQIHSDRSPSRTMGICDMYDHLVGEVKCFHRECRAKQFCPKCKILVKYQSCVMCAKKHTFCQPCIKTSVLRWYEPLKHDEVPHNPWQLISNQFLKPDSWNLGDIKYLCPTHRISMVPLGVPALVSGAKPTPRIVKQSTFRGNKLCTVLE